MRSLIAAGMCLGLVAGCGSLPIPTLSQLIMRPSSVMKATAMDIGYDYDQITVPVAAGREVVIWHIPSKESKALVVVAPGSSSNKSSYVEGLPVFYDDGYDVILMDYEGYGQSPGTPSLQNAADDVVAVTQYALTLHDKVVLYGVSLGSPAATHAAAQEPVKGLILEGCLVLERESDFWLRFQGIPVPFAAAVGDIYTILQTPEGYDILKYIGQVEQPKLIMQSTEDSITPYYGGVEVFGAAPEPKVFWEMKYDHGQMMSQEPDVYAAKVRGWLDSMLGFQSTASQPSAINGR